MIRSASYGVLVAVILILTVPELRNQLANNSLLVGSKEADAPLSYATAVQAAGPAVVNIYSSDIEKSSRYGGKPRQSTRLGSGVIMSEDGYILTNFHVVQNADLIKVLLQNGQLFAAELIGYDVYTDLAVLKVNALNLPVIPQKRQLASVAGDVVLAIGNPLNLGQTVTQGIISATGRNGLSSTNYLEFLQMDAAINQGNSGGALVNTNGELVGINSRKFTQSSPQLNIQGIFFAVPYQLAYKIMQKIIEHGRVTRGWLGITSGQGSMNATGITIDNVADNGPAQKAGLKKGDVIVQIGDIQINSIVQALDIIAETIPGTTLTFTIYRNRQSIELPVTIAEFNNLATG
ncbi:trypsin-like peptidase domain-containing protein [Thalassotalea atypica]|uniref:trypsin-like peptidase domain-containing protein n=1 Tax=Thalassotalea atypica TaxID=2054316 RepID=UPI002572CEC7|nr:trypsin-like peptidase domain-containing protein [Thalassotalea atypica]